MAWILDLDGVVWRGDRPIAGAAGAVDALRARGEAVGFLTNNSSQTVGAYAAKLASMGISAADDEVVTSAQAAATLLEPGSTALVCGGAGVVEALEKRGVDVVADGVPDAVVVGWHREFDFARMAAASTAIRAGARFVATNDDATFPADDGILPGNGAIVASIRVASGHEPVVAGKPNPPMADLLRARLGQTVLAASTLVGDRPDTDGLMARRLGVRFALVLTGVTGRRDLPVQPEPDVVADDLAALVAGVAHRTPPPNSA